MKTIPTPLIPYGGSAVVMRIVDQIEDDWYELEIVPNFYTPYFGWSYPTYRPVAHRAGMFALDDETKVAVPYYSIQLAKNASTGDIVSAYGWLALGKTYEAEAPGRAGFAHYGSGEIALQNANGLSIGQRVYYHKNGELKFRNLSIVKAGSYASYYYDRMRSNAGPFDVPVVIARS